MAGNTVNVKNKNTVPSFSRGTIGQLRKAVADGKISGPAFHFLTEDDKKCLAFVDIDNTIYQINIERISKLEEIVDEMTEGIVDPDTGEKITIVEYVQNNVEPVQEQVTEVQSNVTQIKNSITMVTSVGGDE